MLLVGRQHVELERQLQTGAVRGRLGNLAERGLKSRLVEHVRVQLKDRGAQLAGHVEQRLVGAGERGVVRQPERDLLEVMARREQRLHGTVVEALGEALTLAVLGRQHLGEQVLTIDHELRDLRGAPRDHRREHRAGNADPGEQRRPFGDEARRVAGMVGADVEQRLEHVGEHGHDRGEQREPRPIAEGRR